MKTMLRLIALVLLLVTSGVVTTTTAQADTLTFKVQSSSDYELRMAFYSTSRNVYWPGGGNSYRMVDYDVHNIKLSCRPNERICYGAWQEDGDQHWGVGHAREFGCTKCCYTCKGNTTTGLINLTD